MKVSLLVHSYPLNYIDEQFRQFFSSHMPLSSSLLSWIDDENQYVILRQKLFPQPTAKQTQVTQNAARVTMVNCDSYHQIIGQNPLERKIPMAFIEKHHKFLHNLFIHCKHEARLDGIAREIHTIHDSFFKNTPSAIIRLIVGHRNNLNTERELSRKRPSSSLLKDPLKSSNYTFYLLLNKLLYFHMFILESKPNELRM